MSLDSIRARISGDVGTGLSICEVRKMEITFGELKELVASNPDHPNIGPLAGYVEQFQGKLPDGFIVLADKTIVEAILGEAGTIAEEETRVEGGKVIKRLVLKKMNNE